MWANHHNLMKLIDRVDHGFITLTLLLLMCVAFLPFPTAVMAEHLFDPHERTVAVAFYCGCFTVTAAFYFLMWWHAARGRRLIAAHVPDDAVRAITRAYAPGSFLYLVATLLAFVHVAMSLSIVVGLAVLYMLPRAGAHGGGDQDRFGSKPLRLVADLRCSSVSLSFICSSTDFSAAIQAASLG